MRSEQCESVRTPDQATLHHIRFVLASIQESAESFARSLGATWDGNIVFDPPQKVRVTFLQGAHVNDSLIEQVEPDGPDSFGSCSLERGGDLHDCPMRLKIWSRARSYADLSVR